MTIPEIYEEAERRMCETTKKLNTADPEYQAALRRLVNAITRDLALQQQ